MKRNLKNNAVVKEPEPSKCLDSQLKTLLEEHYSMDLWPLLQKHGYVSLESLRILKASPDWSDIPNEGSRDRFEILIEFAKTKCGSLHSKSEEKKEEEKETKVKEEKKESEETLQSKKRAKKRCARCHGFNFSKHKLPDKTYTCRPCDDPSCTHYSHHQHKESAHEAATVAATKKDTAKEELEALMMKRFVHRYECVAPTTNHPQHNYPELQRQSYMKWRSETQEVKIHNGVRAYLKKKWEHKRFSIMEKLEQARTEIPILTNLAHEMLIDASKKWKNPELFHFVFIRKAKPLVQEDEKPKEAYVDVQQAIEFDMSTFTDAEEIGDNPEPVKNTKPTVEDVD